MKRMQVIFPNGYETELEGEIAKRMIKKNQCEAVKSEEPKRSEPKPMKAKAKSEGSSNEKG